MYNHFFDNDFVQIVKTLENKAGKDGASDSTEALKTFEGKSFCGKINTLKRIANNLGYKLNLELEEKGSNKMLYLNIARALSKDYSSVYYVDLQTNHYIEYTSNARYSQLKIKKEGDDFFKEADCNIKQLVFHEDRDKVLALFNKKRLLNDLAEEQTDLFTFRITHKRQSVYVKAKIVRLKNGEKECLIIGISNVDAQVRRRIEYERAKEETLTLSRIAQTLSKDYFSIYYIDVETDGYIEYSSHFAYKDLKIEKEGDNFYKDCEKNIQRVIHKDDRAKLLYALRKDSLMRETQGNRTFSISYRLILDGMPVHVQLRAVRTYDRDGHHILIGVQNVEEQIKRENYYAHALSAARELANEDMLTGVKNKRAYTEKEAALNAEIVAGIAKEFAVVVFDVNNLKITNDINGHRAGDDRIRQAAETIGKVFGKNSVYRVGGDEFAVILQGSDFCGRYSLIKKMNDLMRKNRDEGKTVVACGMAEFLPGDENVGEVFSRADKVMFIDKTMLKSGH